MPAITKPNQHFDATLITGTAATQVITNAGGFQPDFVWLKSRTNANNPTIYDAIRGVNTILYPSLNNAEAVGSAQLTAFNSNGFTLGASENSNDSSGELSVGWQWKAGGAAVTNNSGTLTSQVSANPTAGFSVVTYSANGSTGTVGHGLGVAPSMIIVKKRNAVERWCVFHTSTSNAYLYLNENHAAETVNANLRFGNNSSVVQPASTVFTIGSANDVNGTSGTYVAYCFAAVAGYSAFGSYTGNGSTDGPFVFTNFRPRFIMFKKTNSTSDWAMFDSSRDSYNVASRDILANLSASEYNDASNNVDFLSNGFKLRSSTADNNNASGATYIYAAFAEAPFKFASAR